MPNMGGVCATTGCVIARVKLARETFLTEFVPGQYPSLTATRKVQDVAPAVPAMVNVVEAWVGVAKSTLHGEAGVMVQE